MPNYVVVEGFGDFTEGLDSCESVKIVARFVDEGEAIAFSSEHYERTVFGEDEDGFRLGWDSAMTFFVLVRTAEELGGQL